MHHLFVDGVQIFFESLYCLYIIWFRKKTPIEFHFYLWKTFVKSGNDTKKWNKWQMFAFVWFWASKTEHQNWAFKTQHPSKTFEMQRQKCNMWNTTSETKILKRNVQNQTSKTKYPKSNVSKQTFEFKFILVFIFKMIHFQSISIKYNYKAHIVLQQ